MRRGAWHGSAWPVRYYPASPPASATTRPVQTLPRDSSPRTTRYPCGRVSCAIFPSSPAASPAGTSRPAGTWLCGDASRPNSGSRIRPGPRRPFPSRTPFSMRPPPNSQKPGNLQVRIRPGIGRSPPLLLSQAAGQPVSGHKQEHPADASRAREFRNFLIPRSNSAAETPVCSAPLAGVISVLRQVRIKRNMPA